MRSPPGLCLLRIWNFSAQGPARSPQKNSRTASGNSQVHPSCLGHEQESAGGGALMDASLEMQEGPELLQDAWIQVLLIFTFISGLFTVNFLLDSAFVHIAPAARNEPGGMPAAGEKRNASRHPGQWIVGREGASDSDFPTVDAALADASDGDVVLLKPGI